MLPQARKCPGLPANLQEPGGEHGAHTCSQPLEATSPADTLIFEFLPPELCETVSFSCLSHPVRGTLRSPRKWKHFQTCLPASGPALTSASLMNTPNTQLLCLAPCLKALWLFLLLLLRQTPQASSIPGRWVSGGKWLCLTYQGVSAAWPVPGTVSVPTCWMGEWKNDLENERMCAGAHSESILPNLLLHLEWITALPPNPHLSHLLVAVSISPWPPLFLDYMCQSRSSSFFSAARHFLCCFLTGRSTPFFFCGYFL